MNVPNANRMMLAGNVPADPVLGIHDPFPDRELACAARTDVCVLISGRGAGIGSLARRIHGMSGWRHGPFVVVDCGWPEALVATRLFDLLAKRQQNGNPCAPYPRLAQTGTIFLEEVGRLELSLQALLAERLAQMRADRRPGRSRWRVIASTSERLIARVDAGTFNDGLFYRLNVIHLTLCNEFIGPSGDTGRNA